MFTRPSPDAEARGPDGSVIVSVGGAGPTALHRDLHEEPRLAAAGADLAPRVGA
jgi:hypothetical protein